MPVIWDALSFVLWVCFVWVVHPQPSMQLEADTGCWTLLAVLLYCGIVKRDAGVPLACVLDSGLAVHLLELPPNHRSIAAECVGAEFSLCTLLGKNVSGARCWCVLQREKMERKKRLREILAKQRQMGHFEVSPPTPMPPSSRAPDLVWNVSLLGCQGP